MPVVRKTYKAVLLDMDGTLIDSTKAVEAHWKNFGTAHGIDGEEILKSSHGVRSLDVIARWAPEKANMAYVLELEAAIPRDNGDSAIALPGAKDLLHKLRENNAPWAIVTSGTSVLASAWVEKMELETPPVFITADKVTNGKPHPEGYMTARKMLGAEGLPTLVVEDAPAGAKAGKRAGCDVLGLLTSHKVLHFATQLEFEDQPDWIVPDLSFVKVLSAGPEGVELEFDVPEVPIDVKELKMPVGMPVSVDLAE
ncbi:haloacid dehalogenase-like hydrolase [Ascobolus immersus RN42]|uniref:Haloacid dehalogenase-like hydrolase n=1 Tax=Ascobolus immersus RN42 TaxID=1160509 RepID=A0A3N4INW4_ASCIM|nr:haloacid dehalogenase-like hydrolase [Ascobolus immersus RN42]